MKTGKIKRYPGLLIHLVLSSALIGFAVCFVFNAPALLLGRFHNGIWRFSNRFTLLGVTLLRACQPWWRGKIQVQVPEHYWSGESGTLFVSNHRSHMDVFLLLQQIPGIRILTKHVIFLIPGLNLAAFLFQMIRVKRGAEASFWKAMDQVEKALKDKHNVHVFPEMTRCQFGEKKLGRFTLAPFQKAISVGVPVIPVAIWGTDYHWPRGVYAIARKGPLVVESLPAIDSKSFSSASELAHEVRRQIESKIEELSKKYPYEDQV